MALDLSHRDVDYARVASMLSAALGRKWNVDIVFGESPATNGSTVYLPHWPMDDPKMRNALYGLIAHEAGGHIRQTDFEVLATAFNHRRKKLGNLTTVWKSLENILEDIRIEANILREYAGANQYLAAAAEIMFNVHAPEEEDETAPLQYWATCLNWCVVAFRQELLGQKLLTKKREQAEERALKVVNKTVLEEAMQMARKAHGLDSEKRSYREVLILADDLLALFEEAAQEDTSSQTPEANDEQQQQSCSSDEDASGKSESEATSDGTDQSKEEPAQDPEKGSSDGDALDSDDTGGQAATPSEPGREIDRETVPTRAVGSMLEALCEEAKKEAPATGFEPADGSLHTICSASTMDQTEKRNVTQHFRRSQALVQNLIPAISPLLIGDSWIEQDQKRGRKISDRRLASTKTDNDPRVFQKRMVEDDQSVAAHVLVDRSGSTQNGLLDEIQVAALALVQSLEQFCLVDVALSHFPNRDRAGMSLTKPFHVPVRRTLLNWGSSFGCTPLHWALEDAAYSFSQVRNDRKIVFVVTDGKPDCPELAERSRRFAKLFGVEVIGIVISKIPYPSGIFDDSIQIEKAADLPTAMKQLVLRNLS